MEEGIVVGGGCTLLRLAAKVDVIKDSLDDDEEKVLVTDNQKYGYNTATGNYEDLMAVGIIDPTKEARMGGIPLHSLPSQPPKPTKAGRKARK